MIVYIYNIGVDLYNGFNGLRHRINWTYFTVLNGLAHPLYSADRIIGIHFGKIKEISMEEKENVYVLETDRKIPDQSDLQIIEQTGNTYKLEVNSVMEVLSNLEKQGVQVKNITQIHKTLEDVYNEFIQEASL